MASGSMPSHATAMLFIPSEFEFVGDLMTSSSLGKEYNSLEELLQAINVFFKRQSYAVIIRDAIQLTAS